MKFFTVAADLDSKAAVEANGWFITVVVSSGQLKLCRCQMMHKLIFLESFNLKNRINSWRGMGEKEAVCIGTSLNVYSLK